MDEDQPLIVPAALLFDMDGTLTQPLLDFPRIKAELGIGTRPILEALAEMGQQERQEAERVLHRHEEHAAEQSTLSPGCLELLTWLAERNITTALITRNSRQSVMTVVERHRLPIQTLVTREDALPKPDPAPLLLACRKLRVAERAVWMVGDGQYDIEAGRAAKIRTVWVSRGRNRDFSAEPWRQVRDLIELRLMLAGALDPRN